MAPTARSKALALSSLAFLVLAAHGRSLGSGFCWDDAFLVLSNEHVRGFDVARILGGGLWSGAGIQVSYWRPLTLLTIAAQLALTQAPWFLHLGNVALHLSVVILAYAVALRGTSSVLAAFMAAALLGVHPLTVEAVSGISNRGDVLASGFALIAVLLHGTSLSPARMVGTAMAVFAGCACKETGVAALPALLAWDLGFRANGDPAVLLRMLRGRLGIAWAALGAAVISFLLVRYAVVGGFAISPEFLRNPLSVAPWATQRVLALAVLGHAVRLAVWPARLSVDYSFHSLPTDVISAAPLALLGAAVIVAIAIIAARSSRRDPLVTFGIVFAVVAWLPVSNLIFPVEVMFAERFLYMPAVGGCLALGGVAARLLESGRRSDRVRLTAAAGALVLTMLAGRAISRTLDWTDQRALVAAATVATPTNARVQVAWAQLLVQERRWPEADVAYARAIDIWPEFSTAWTERAAVLRNLGRVDDAIAAAYRGVRLDPHDPICWYNLVLELAVAGRFGAALEIAREGLARHPGFDPLVNLAATLQQQHVGSPPDGSPPP